jgi:hypothetical protein
MKKIRKPRKLVFMMNRLELKSALTRAIILEFQNSKNPGQMLWGWDRPPSLYVARENRIRLAKRYSKLYGPVSLKLFERKLPSGNEWTGVKDLL